MNKRNKILIALLLVLCVGLVGLTIAYFSNSDTIENQFITKEYGTTYTEEFVSPDNWLPGDTTDKTIVATNTGQVDEAVRISLTESWTTHNNGTLNGWIHPDGTKSNHTTEEELSNDESVAILNLANTSDWTKVGDYYYYNYKLAPGESTTSFLESVTFNSKTKLDDTCVTTEENGVKTVTCNSSGNDYDHATYKLTLTIETVQYNKFADAWNTGNSVTIAEERPQGVNFAQHIMSKSNAASITNYTDGVTTEAYTFNHEATEQTPALTDYRYIGASPNNYVEFNCDDNGENCETWRAIGVFYVDDGNNNWEWRVKLVRGSAFSETMYWNTNGPNDWTTASLKNTLNNSYLNSLSTSAKSMIEDVKYYLGGAEYNNGYGTTDAMYLLERGNELCKSCGSDTNKLTWTGVVGLMYPSDEYMVYSKGIDDNCYNNPNKCKEKDFQYNPIKGEYEEIEIENPGYPQTGWIYNSNIESETISIKTWLLSPSSNDSTSVFYVHDDGGLGNYETRFGSFSVRPTLYLSSSVKTTSGDGSIDSPYKLSL